MKLSFTNFLPLVIGSGITLIVYSAVGWWGFLFLGFWVGGWITVGALLASSQKGLKRDLGRRISILVIGLTLMIFLGVSEHENLQIEENIFYLAFFPEVLSLVFSSTTRLQRSSALFSFVGVFVVGLAGLQEYWIGCRSSAMIPFPRNGPISVGRCSSFLCSSLSFSFGPAMITWRFTLIKHMVSGDNFAGLL
jgi:hypothetical protein